MPAAADLFHALVEGFSILLVNPWRCLGVTLLQFATAGTAMMLVLLGWVAFLAQTVVNRRLATLQSGDSRLRELFVRAVAVTGGGAPPLRIAGPGQPAGFTVGLMRPEVVISREIADALPDDELIALFLHEIAHVRRRDNLRRLATTLLGLLCALLAAESLTLKEAFVDHLFRFDLLPAIELAGAFVVAWLTTRPWISEALEYAREVRCDDSAAVLCGDPLVVASAILHVWRLTQADRGTGADGKFAAFIGASGIERRVRRLIDPDYVRHVRTWTLVRGAALAGLVVCATTIVLQ